MKFGPNITKQITDELKKIPNVRYVCKKFGIHPSTYYRWVLNDWQFHKAVEGALVFGREQMNDAAQGVIISGIQNGDRHSAIYWLAHNDERYLHPSKILHYQYIERNVLEFLKKELPEKSLFEELFDTYFYLEEKCSEKEALKIISPIIDTACQSDVDLVAIFFIRYKEWKQFKIMNEEERIKLELNLTDKENRG